MIQADPILQAIDAKILAKGPGPSSSRPSPSKSIIRPDQTARAPLSFGSPVKTMRFVERVQVGTSPTSPRPGNNSPALVP
jgi:hypothetical protein